MTTTNKLTFNQAQKELNEIGVALTKDPYGEYWVRVKGSPPGNGYPTPDLMDAYETGKQMVRHLNHESGN